MKISSKLRYSLFLMRELVLSYDKQLVQIKNFAIKTGLSFKYLEQVVLLLRKSNLIQSVRGVKGGYKLVLPPDQVNLYQILEATQGGLDPGQECLASSSKGECCHSSYCPNFSLWKILDDIIRDKLLNTSLEQFVMNLNSSEDVDLLCKDGQ